MGSVEKRLVELEALILETQTEARRNALGHARRLSELEAVVERLWKGEKRVRVKEPEVAALLARFSEVSKERVPLPDPEILRGLCHSELVALATARGVPATRGIRPSEIIHLLEIDEQGEIATLTRERKEVDWLIHHWKTWAASLTCGKNCTTGCPDAMVASCYYTNHAKAAKLRQELADEQTAELDP